MCGRWISSFSSGLSPKKPDVAVWEQVLVYSYSDYRGIRIDKNDPGVVVSVMHFL